VRDVHRELHAFHAERFSREIERLNCSIRVAVGDLPVEIAGALRFLLQRPQVGPGVRQRDRAAEIEESGAERVAE
jgi:hypothetical protein